MKMLITAFEPFGGETVNPSMKAVEALESTLSGFRIYKLTVPTAFYRSIWAVREKMLELKPDVVLMVGQAGGSTEITPERIAINLNDARIKDNDGCQPIDERIYKDGKNAYFSTLPVKAMVKGMRERGIPSSLSNSAGTFVCNHLMYGVLYTIEKEQLSARAGFLHVPYLTEQAENKKDAGSMTLPMIVEGLKASIHAISLYGKDLKIPLGKEY